MTNTLQKAKALALDLHKSQRYGDHPYSKHLQDVVLIAEDFGLDANCQAACWLHDSIEDCGISYQQVKDETNETIAEMVYAVTDELGRNRKERKAKTYPKLAKNQQAIQVKLCDRIANLSQSIRDGKVGLIEMYRKEHPEFKRLLCLFQDEKSQRLWGRLEELMR